MMELIFIVICIVMIVVFNTKGDTIHRANDGWVAHTDNPIVQAQHATNGCMGVLMWIGLVLAILAVFGGIAAGGGG